MDGSRSHSRNASESRRTTLGGPESESILDAVLDTRQLEAFGRKVTATASHLMGDTDATNQAMTSLSRTMRRPGLQRSVFSFAQTAPSEFVRSKVSTSEIAHRALTYIPDEQLAYLPETETTYSLFEGFQASLPESENEHRKGHRRRASRQKLLTGGDIEEDGPPTLASLKKKRNVQNHKLEMMGIRKNMCGTEIHEIDNKISNLNYMRRVVLDRLAALENEEVEAEQQLQGMDNQIELMQEELEDQAALQKPADAIEDQPERALTPEVEAMDASFMSESIYSQLPSPSSSKKKKRPNFKTRRSMPILHEHLESGSNLKTLAAHTEIITALDFDVPFGTAVTASLDDTLRVWDLNLGRCMGFLEGHTASVRCLQVDSENPSIVASGSLDATVRLWDLSKANYEPHEHRDAAEADADDDGLGFGNEHEDAPPPPPPDAMADTPLYVLEAHVDAVTALHLRGDTLITGSADKTLRQWDLVKGRCVQTLDVLWAAAQASATTAATDGLEWRPAGARAADSSADFVGALQCFEAALACGTADGMVRLWDLRSGQVHRSLVGHTGAVSCLQFDDVHLVTGSADRSIRIWDLRTGSIFDAFAYESPISAMMFDTRHIASAAGEDVVKVYDKTDGRHWNCGAGTTSEEDGSTPGIVEQVRIKDGYMVEGRRDGIVGVWTC